MKKIISFALAISMIFSLIGCTPKTQQTSGLKAGTYVETVKGFGGDMEVEVVLTQEGISAVTVKNNSETQDVAGAALTEVPAAIVANQSIGVDGVAGATVSSNAIKLAVEQAITKAGGDITKFNTEVATSTSMLKAPLTNEKMPTEWDMTYDVVVVGAGFAGMAAAHSAQDSGASTILVEQMPKVGGQSAINGGQYAAYTSTEAKRLQEKFNLVPDTAKQHIADTIAGGDNLPQKELVEVMVNGAPLYLNILLENGLVIRDVLARPGGHYGYRTYVTENSIGSDITNLQQKIVLDSGVDLQLNTKMTQIFQDETGKVVGILVATKDGLKSIKAEKGVILTTGGFSSNVEMRLKYDPKLTADMPTTNNPSSTGEGLMMAMELGAGVTGMEYIQRYPFANPENGVLDTVAVMPFTGPSYGIVYVDENGKRYVNEGERRDVCADAAVATGGTTTFSILNRELASWVPDKDIQKGIDSGRIIVGETFEELVENINAKTYQGKQISMDASTLKATIETHNTYIDNLKDPDFGKVMSETMAKIENGPYMAIPQWPAVHHTMGGLTITPNAQVLDTNGKVIPGLFAAGEVTGGIHGTNRLGSNADADACTFGMVAGVYAATGENPVKIQK